VARTPEKPDHSVPIPIYGPAAPNAPLSAASFKPAKLRVSGEHFDWITLDSWTRNMCGRSALTARTERLVEVTGAVRYEALGHEWLGPNYNVCPGSFVPVLVRGLDTERLEDEDSVKEATASDDLLLVSMKWGLIPSYTKAGEEKSGFKMINARSETIATKNAFRRLIQRRRCVFLCDGFFEWKRSQTGSKDPYFIQLKASGDGAVNGHPFMRIAGLWDKWHDQASDNTVHSFTLLTSE
jgi:putative SOS response-associated peptidase YedK